MPATVLDADAIILNFSEPYIQTRYLDDGVTEATLYKLCRAVSVGFLEESGEAIDTLEPQRFAYTATEGFLDIHANYWLVPRSDGESDAALRLRIGLAKLMQWGAFNVDDMLVLLATLLETDVGSITFTENIDESEAFEPGLITFNINPDVFTSKGITDVATAVADLEADMERVAPAGVRVRVTTAGSAVYDDGDLYDDGETYS